VSGYEDMFKIDYDTVSEPFSHLYKESGLKMSYTELVAECECVFETIQLSEEQARNVEMASRDQSYFKVWLLFRAGRVTASKLKAACHTDFFQPSQSLIKAICYPESSKFISKATKWGCDHKKTAHDAYLQKIQ